MRSWNPLTRSFLLPLLLAGAATGAVAQMNMGGEGMGAEPAKPKAMKMAKKPAPPAVPARPMAAPASSPEPMGEMKAPVTSAMPEPAKGTEATAGPAMAMPKPAGMKEMDEPAPSSLNGAWLLVGFGILNAAVIAVAAILKFKRSNAEVKA